MSDNFEHLEALSASIQDKLTELENLRIAANQHASDAATAADRAKDMAHQAWDQADDCKRLLTGGVNEFLQQARAELTQLQAELEALRPENQEQGTLKSTKLEQDAIKYRAEVETLSHTNGFSRQQIADTLGVTVFLVDHILNSVAAS